MVPNQMSEDSALQKVDRRTVLKGVGAAGAAGVGGAALFSSSAAADGDFEIAITNPSAVRTDDGSVAWLALGSQGQLWWEGFDESVEQFDFRVQATVENVDTNEVLLENHTLYNQSGIDASEGFGRPDDSGDSGTRGRIKWAIPDPVNSTEDDPCWLIARNDDLMANPDESTGDEYNAPDGAASYTLPDAFNTDVFDVDDDGSTETFRVTVTKRARLRAGSGAYLTGADHEDDDRKLMENPTGEGQFTFNVENLPADADFTGEGAAESGGDPEKSN